MTKSSLVSTAGSETQLWMQREIGSPAATRAAERLSVCGRPTQMDTWPTIYSFHSSQGENVVEVEEDFFSSSIFAKNMGKDCEGKK